MYTAEQSHQDTSREVALKRKLIQDPDQPFWEGARPKLGVTLGESVVFSILSLLLDADRTLRQRDMSFRDHGSVIRFSHPNWISSKSVRALQCFRDAAVVALSALLEGFNADEQDGRITLPAATLRDIVRRHRPTVDGLPNFSDQYNHRDYERCAKGTINDVQWEFVFESCAAGFPYLLQDDRDIFEDTLRTLPEGRRVRKVLVVDVGAGSTDAGYLVRTVRPRDAQGIMWPLLIWLPAADALELAGMWLTDRIYADLQQQRPLVTLGEAEDTKLNRQLAWLDKPYVREWSERIAAHVSEYAKVLRDEVCLPRSPGLEVVITGGSSAVQRMRDKVLDEVIRALVERGLPIGTATRLIQPDSFGLQAGGYEQVQLAQLAVSLGASNPLLSELKAYPDGLLQPAVGA
ncbi:MAG: hypothetical protein ABSE27_08695 [Acidobacteriaceae bacterium]|jgi:hypothetical protein